MFEIIFGNFAPCLRVLSDNIHESLAALVISYKCVVGFALLSVFRAVFFQQTLEVAQQDRDSVFSRKVPQITLENQHLAEMLKQLDHNADGNISWEEFTSELSENSEMKTWMSAMDFRIQDLTVLFDILDDGTGVIDFHEFLIAASRIKGQARAVDIAKLLHNQQKIDTKLNMLQMFGPKAINPSAIRHLDSKESKEDKVTKESKELSTNGIASKQHESHSSGKEKAYEDAENSLHARPVPFHQGPHLDSLPREDMVTDAGKDQGAYRGGRTWCTLRAKQGHRGCRL
jgi:hypothetical protein